MSGRSDNDMVEDFDFQQLPGPDQVTPASDGSGSPLWVVVHDHDGLTKPDWLRSALLKAARQN